VLGNVTRRGDVVRSWLPLFVVERSQPSAGKPCLDVRRLARERGGLLNIEFLSTVAVIAPDPPRSRRLYVDALGLPLQGEPGDYQHSEQIGGCKSFGIWPLFQAAEACFGTPEWPAGRPVPQVSIEFDVEDAAAVIRAVEELEQALTSATSATRTELEGRGVGVDLDPWTVCL